MPKCKNDSSRTYVGNEPSPTGLGFCSNGEEINTLREGKDGNFWKVSQDKNGKKRWTKSNLKNYFSLEMFFQVRVITPIELKNYLPDIDIFKKITKDIIPELISKGIKAYLIPLPLSDNGIYWSDFAGSYLNKFFGEKYFDEEYVKLTIYFNNDLSINTEKNIKLNYDLNKENQQVVYDIFRNHLPYNFYWSGLILESMTINYEKSKNKIKKITVKNISYYPIANVNIYTEKSDLTLFDQEPLEAEELYSINKIKKKCIYMDYEYDIKNLFLTFYGVKDLRLIEKLVKEIEKEMNLTYYALKYKINKIICNISKNKEDHENKLLL